MLGTLLFDWLLNQNPKTTPTGEQISTKRGKYYHIDEGKDDAGIKTNRIFSSRDKEVGKKENTNALNEIKVTVGCIRY